MTDSLELRVECTSGKSPKLLYRVCTRGILVWCIQHKRQELHTWQELEAMHQRVIQAENQVNEAWPGTVWYDKGITGEENNHA